MRARACVRVFNFLCRSERVWCRKTLQHLQECQSYSTDCKGMLNVPEGTFSFMHSRSSRWSATGQPVFSNKTRGGNVPESRLGEGRCTDWNVWGSCCHLVKGQGLACNPGRKRRSWVADGSLGRTGCAGEGWKKSPTIPSYVCGHRYDT